MNAKPISIKTRRITLTKTKYPALQVKTVKGKILPDIIKEVIKHRAFSEQEEK